MKWLALIPVFWASLAQGPTLPFGFVPQASGGGHALTLVQTWHCTFPGTGSNTHLNCAAGSGYTTGNLLFYFGEASPSYINPSASSAGTWHQLPSTTAGQFGASGYITGVTGGTTSFTLTTPSAYFTTAYVVGLIFEFSGVNSSPIDSGGSANCGWIDNYSGTSSCGVTTTGSYDAVCSFVAATTAGSGYSAGSGYTAISISAITDPASPQTVGLIECSTTALTPGSYTPTFITGGATTQDDGTVSIVLL